MIKTLWELENRKISLDVLRSIAIWMVLLCHFNLVLTENDVFTSIIFRKIALFLARGVELFFILSGFLITNQLIENYRIHGKVFYKIFFIKRTFKIFPLYIFLICIYLGMGYLNSENQEVSVFYNIISFL